MTGGDRRKNGDSTEQRKRSARSPWRQGPTCRTNRAKDTWRQYQERGSDRPPTEEK